MEALAARQHAVGLAQPIPRPTPAESRWDLAFVGIIGYLIVEYTRLPAMYPVLQIFDLGKVTVGLGALGLLLARRVRSEHRTIVYFLDTIFVYFVLASLLSTLFAAHPDLAWDGLVDTLIWVVIYFLVGRVVNSAWRLKIFIFLFLLLNLKLAQHGIRYFYGSLKSYNEMVVVTQGAGGGSTGYFSNSADFGVAMCVAWAIATTLLFARFKSFWRIVLLVTSLIILASIFVCGSRGAVVGAACISLVAWVKSPQKKMAAVVMAALLAIGIIFVLPEASIQRFQSARDPYADKTANQRLYLWKEGLVMLRDHPVLGVGLRNFPVVRMAGYIDPEDTNTHMSVPHSLYIQAVSELGVAGTLPIVVLWVTFFIVNSKTRKRLLALNPENRRSFEYCLAIGLDLAMVGYLTSGAFVAVLYYPHLWVLLGLSVGLYTSVNREMARSSEPELQEGRPELAQMASLQEK